MDTGESDESPRGLVFMYASWTLDHAEQSVPGDLVTGRPLNPCTFTSRSRLLPTQAGKTLHLYTNASIVNVYLRLTRYSIPNPNNKGTI